MATTDNPKRHCRICHKSSGILLSPCSCKGTISSAHEKCLKEWILKTKALTCSVCSQHFLVTKVLQRGAPSKAIVTTLDSANGNVLSVAFLKALCFVMTYFAKKVSALSGRLLFFVVMWLIVLPFTASLTWMALFRWELLEELILEVLGLRLPSFAVKTAGPSAPADGVTLRWWYGAGIGLGLLSVALGISIVSWWEWCQDHVALFGGEAEPQPQNAPTAVEDSSSDEEPAPRDPEANSVPDSETGRETEKDINSSEENKLERMKTGLQQGSDKTSSDQAAPPLVKEATVPRVQPSGGMAREAGGSSPQHTPVSALSPKEAASAIDVLAARYGDERRGNAVLSHFGLQGSLLEALVVVTVFTILIPVALIWLVKLPLYVGKKIIGNGLLTALQATDAMSLLPVTLLQYVVVASELLFEIAPIELFPHSRTPGDPMTHGSTPRSVTVLAWFLGALTIGGVLSTVVSMRIFSVNTRRSILFVTSFGKGLVAHGIQLLVLPALFGFLLCMLCVPYITAMSSDHETPVTFVEDYPQGPPVGALHINEVLSTINLDICRINSSRVWPSMSPLLTLRALRSIHKSSKSAVRLWIGSYFAADGCGGALLPPALFAVSQLLTNQSTSAALDDNTMVFSFATVLTNVHVFDDPMTFLTLFLPGLMLSTVVWSSWYHVRRLTHVRVFRFLFAEALDAPVGEQIVRCSHLMVLFLCIRNIALILLPLILVVRPALWTLSLLFPEQLPVLVSWTSGSVAIDAIAGNLLMFSGRIARFFGLLRGQPGVEEEFLFRRVGMIVEFIREAHEFFFEYVAEDVGLTNFLRTGDCPSSRSDFLFPFRLALLALAYCVLATVVVIISFLPGVALTAATAVLRSDARVEPFVAYFAQVESVGMNAVQPQHGNPLTIHSVLIGWCLIFIAHQLGELFLPSLSRMYSVLRFKILHRRALEAHWLRWRLLSLTSGLIELEYYRVSMTHREGDTRIVEGMTVSMRALPSRHFALDGACGPAEWLCPLDTILQRVAHARQSLEHKTCWDMNTLTTVAGVLTTMESHIQSISAQPLYSKPHAAVPKAGLGMVEAYALCEALSLGRWERARLCLSLSVFFTFACGLVIVVPLSLGAGTLHLFLSGSTRSSTQCFSTGAPSGWLAPLLPQSASYLLTCWATGAVVLYALVPLWKRTFPRMAKCFFEYWSYGLYCFTSLRNVLIVGRFIVCPLVWFLSGFTFIPHSFPRLMRCAFRLVRSTNMFSNDFEASESEILLVHLGLAGWVAVALWVMLVSVIGDKVPFVIDPQAWRSEMQRKKIVEYLSKVNDTIASIVQQAQGAETEKSSAELGLPENTQQSDVVADRTATASEKPAREDGADGARPADDDAPEADDVESEPGEDFERMELDEMADHADEDLFLQEVILRLERQEREDKKSQQLGRGSRASSGLFKYVYDMLLRILEREYDAQYLEDINIHSAS